MTLKLLTLFAVSVALCYSQVDKRFVGVGYDIVTGNPDGDFTTSWGTGTDPGIKSLRRILDLPDNAVESIARSSCVTKTTVFENSEKYQTKLEQEINVKHSSRYAGFKFSASAGLQQAHEETVNSESLVHESITYCNTGGARYKSELAESEKFTVDDSFAAAVCDLPSDYNSNNKETYMNFISTWGTFVITTAKLGTKSIERKQASRLDVLIYAESKHSGSISAEGGYKGFHSSLAVDFRQFESDSSFEDIFTSNLVSYTIGTDSLPEPIELTIDEIVEFLTTQYWSHLDTLKSRDVCPSSFDLSHMKSQLDQALTDYPEWLDTFPISNEIVQIPNAWPSGTYGLLATKCIGTQPCHCTVDKGQCPSGTWFHGSKRAVTESNSKATPSINCLAAPVSLDKKPTLSWNFCMKLESTGSYRRNWPEGSYCIFKKGDCPSGFEFGAIWMDDYWVDDDDVRNPEGYYPDGSYGVDTIFHYCCRNDAFPVNPIYLPTDKPFVLFPVTKDCQEVHGMTAEKVWVFVDGASGNRELNGLTPYDEVKNKDDHSLLMCYYK